jgi:hypothetical protein
MNRESREITEEAVLELVGRQLDYLSNTIRGTSQRVRESLKRMEEMDAKYKKGIYQTQ